MNFVKARAAVEHIGKQLAEAMNAADRLEARIPEAEHAIEEAIARHHAALEEVERLKGDFLQAERILAFAQAELASTNGEAGGAAYNATIRTEPNDNQEKK